MADTHRNRIEIKSASSSRVYVVSERVRNGVGVGWECSCPGWKAYGRCKHLRAMGLTSSRAPITPAAKGDGKTDNAGFGESAYRHYDPRRDGYGYPEEWFKLAEQWARGRRYTKPTRVHSSLANDLNLLGLSEMPDEAIDLVRAMRRRAKVLHPDFGGSAEAFDTMMQAFQRLQKMY